MKHLIPVICVCLLLASCGRAEDDSATLKIAALRGPSAVAMVQWMDSLARADNPSSAITIYDEPLQLRKRMLEGSVDFAVLPTTMAALLYNGGVDYRIVAVPLWGTLYLCGTDTSVATLEDLKGRKVHLMAKGMTPDVTFRHLLEKRGLKPGRDVATDYRFPTHMDLANAAIAGKAELCVLSEPFASQAVNANPRLHILVDLGAEWEKSESVPMAETAFLCRGDLAGNDAVKEIVGALERSAGWVSANPDSAATLAVKYGINPDRQAISRSIPNSHIKVTGTSDAETEIKSYLAIILRSAPDAVGGRMPDEKFYAK